MYLVILGTLLVILKVAGVGPVGEWSWLGVLWPFAIAVAWWAWADSSGWTKRREIEKMEEKKRGRRVKNMTALGLDTRGRRTDFADRGFRDLQSSKIEGKRDEIRRKNKAVLARSTRPGALDSRPASPADSRY